MKKQYDDDDGRVIANMDVDGMPWYLRRVKRDQPQSEEKEPLKLDRGERWAMFKGVFAAVLLILAVFGVCYFLFIFILDQLMMHA